ncbi:MAG: hypothetical protein WC565_09175 [Parcubacteria group bacterium]
MNQGVSAETYQAAIEALADLELDNPICTVYQQVTDGIDQLRQRLSATYPEIEGGGAPLLQLSKAYHLIAGDNDDPERSKEAHGLLQSIPPVQRDAIQQTVETQLQTIVQRAFASSLSAEDAQRLIQKMTSKNRAAEHAAVEKAA